MRNAAFLLALALCLAGCIYKIDIQQGNLVTQESVSKLKKGMTKSEVRQLLGTPLLTDPFHANRWDYYFSNATRGKTIERTRLSVFFDNDKLVSVTGDVKAAAPAQASATPAPSATPAAPATSAKPAAAPTQPPSSPGK